MKFTVKAAARATGITESRLRTWERRYGIPAPARSDTGRRQYTDEDIAVIRRMAALVEAGMAASDAAEAARGAAPGDVSLTPIAVAAESPLIGGIVDAALAYDEAGLVSDLRQARDDLDWAAALEDVIFPAMRRIGSAWMDASASVASEHFASQLLRREMASALGSLPLPGEGPLIVLACPEGEQHDLGLLALALLLRRAGRRVIYLGADVPAVDLLSVAAVTQASAICLSATSDSGVASLVRTTRTILAARGPRLFVGGPATPEMELAPGMRLPASLSQAVETIESRLSSD